MKPFRQDLTAERLRELMIYDPATGNFRWRVKRKGRKLHSNVGCLANGYRLIKIDGVMYMAHRLAWLYVYGRWPVGRLDHEDTIGYHNWILNLREATHAQNQWNRGRSRANSTGFKGVQRDGKKFTAKITVNKRILRLGSFDDPRQAHRAYCVAAVEHHGEFARFE